MHRRSRQTGDSLKRHSLGLGIWPGFVGTIFVIAAFLRLAAIGAIPLPVMQDELSDIYDGYSIAETGRDRSGIPFPVVVRGFGEGDYRPALYPWLTAIPAKFVGFSVAAGRLPSAILGCLTVAILFFFARNVGGGGFGLASLALAAFSPWLVFFSRVAHQGAMLPPFFMALTFFLWERTDARNFSGKMVLLLGFAVGFSANAYPGTRITSLLMALCISIFIVRQRNDRLRALGIFAIGAFLGALPQILLLATEPEHFFARSQVTLLDAESPLKLIGLFLHGFELNLRPRYLFAPNMVETYMTPARLLPIEAFLFYPGFFALLLLGGKIARFRPYIYAAAAIAILPAALTGPNPHSIRASSFAALTPLFSAATIIVLRDWFTRRFHREKAFDFTVAAAITASVAIVGIQYLRNPIARGFRMQNGLTEMSRMIGHHTQKYDRVLIENSGEQPYLYVVAFTGMAPRDYMTATKSMGSSSNSFDKVRQVGKYFFLDSASLRQRATLATTGSNQLFVSKGFIPGLSLVDSVRAAGETYYAFTRFGGLDD